VRKVLGKSAVGEVLHRGVVLESSVPELVPVNSVRSWTVKWDKVQNQRGLEGAARRDRTSLKRSSKRDAAKGHHGDVYVYAKSDSLPRATLRPKAKTLPSGPDGDAGF
jgi:hypothetical protein